VLYDTEFCLPCVLCDLPTWKIFKRNSLKCSSKTPHFKSNWPHSSSNVDRLNSNPRLNPSPAMTLLRGVKNTLPSFG